jgi:molybdenum cofactor synthesis domain-containing protein
MLKVMSKTYQAAILIIGNEILSGRTQDSNTAWIADKLGARGIAVREVRIVPDEETAIVKALNELRQVYDYVLTTGGIGPTHDDITAEAIAAAFGVSCHVHPEARERLVNYYGSEEAVNDARLKMATIPEGATLIDNPVSGAPGFVIKNVFCMAGVPRIMQAMLDHVMSMMEQGVAYLSNTVTCSLMESKIALDLKALQDKYPHINIGSYPNYRGGQLGLSLALRGTDVGALQAATDELIALIRHLGDEPKAISLQSKAS